MSKRKLTDEQVHAIRADARSDRATAAAYGVSPSAISAIRCGRYYQGVPLRDDARMRRGAGRRSFEDVAYLVVGGTCLIPGATSDQLCSVHERTKRLGFKVKSKTTNRGLRIWRIA